MTYSNANFTPSLKGYNNVKPFRFWCQKVLPLVYDDSLSYYELLCKVVDYLNNVISDLSATEDNVGDLLTAYNQLQDYVNNYFTNLDVQEEINTKLDAMFEDGTIPTMIEEYVHPFIETLNENYAELDSQINETMSTQNENIANLTARVNNLVVNNTTNLTGYNVVTVESTTAEGGSTVTENISKDAEILQVYYSGYNDTNDTLKSDNISYVSTPNVPSSTQQQVVVTITDSTDTRFNVFITYAISQDIEIAELTDIRVGYDGTVYSSAGNAVRSQVSNLKNDLDVSPKAFPGEFERGSLKTNGSPYDDQSTHQNRVISSASVQTKNGWNLLVKDGFRFMVFFYSTDSILYASENSGWQTTSSTAYTINSQYPYMRILISRVTENASEVADIDEFVSSVIAYTSDISLKIGDIDKEIAKNEENIEYVAIETGIADPKNYWKTYLDGILPTLKANLYSLGNHGDSLYFFTDYHYDKNADAQNNGEKLKNIIMWLLKNIETKKVFCGGDIIQVNDTVDDALTVLNNFYKNFNKTTNLFYNIVGNHDNNQYNSSARLTDSQMYQILFAGFEIDNKTELTTGMYYYFDNKPQKIRYICLNTKANITQFRVDTAQGDWLIDTLNNTPNNYSIVVIMHWFFEPDGDNIVYSLIGTWVETLLNAYNSRGSGTWQLSDGTNTTSHSYDFTNAVGKIIGVLSGHTHKEYEVDSTGNYPIICFPCDAYKGSNQSLTRTLGTYTEHSIFQVCIDTTNKSIKITPIGAGNSHTYYFDQ